MRHVALALILGLLGCGDGDFYEGCDDVDDCDAPEDIDAECLEKSTGDGGFCTWSCETDADCNAFDDDDEWSFVCAPFESTEGTHCFPSCEGAEDDDPDACPDGTSCRSTGGGDENRKICGPE